MPKKSRVWVNHERLFDLDEDSLGSGEFQQRTTVEIRRRLNALVSGHEHLANVARTALHLIENNVHIPEIAEALGLPSPIPRAERKGRRPLWKLRPGSDADIVATLVESSRRRGMSEPELVKALQERGRLANAAYPQRSVHWTLTNLKKRTQAVIRNHATGRWHAMNSLEHFRGKPKASTSGDKA